MKLSLQRNKCLDGVTLMSNGVAAVQLGELILLNYFNGTGDVGYSSSINVKEALKMSHFHYGDHIWCIFENEILVCFDLNGKYLAHTNISPPINIELFEIGKDLCIYPYGIFRLNELNKRLHDVFSLDQFNVSESFKAHTFLSHHNKLIILKHEDLISIDVTGLSGQNVPKISKIISIPHAKGLGQVDEDTILVHLNNGSTPLDYTLTFATENDQPFGKQVFNAFPPESGLLMYSRSSRVRNLLVFRRNSSSKVYLQEVVTGMNFLGNVSYQIKDISFHYPWVFLKSMNSGKWNVYLLEEG